MGDHGVVAGGGEGDVAGVDGDGVGAGDHDLQVGEGLAGEPGQVLGVTEREPADHGLTADDHVDVGVGDAVEQVDAGAVLGRRRCGDSQE